MQKGSDRFAVQGTNTDARTHRICEFPKVRTLGPESTEIRSTPTLMSPTLERVDLLLATIGVVVVLALSGAAWMAFLVLRGRK